LAGGNTWVAADPHFGHENICRFMNYDGSKVRPWDTAEEMDAALIENWNGVVLPNDRVYLLGDVAFKPRVLRAIIPRLNGRIVLVQGNHDTEEAKLYAELFDDVRGYVVKKGFIMSHIPIHPACLSRWAINIHGHLHGNTIRDNLALKEKEQFGPIDPRYVCVSMEQINYTPKLLSKVLQENGL